MDNLTHSLVAFTCTRLMYPQASTGAVVAAIVSASFPDIDVCVGQWGRAHYLAYHRGLTHGLPGLFVCGLFCAALAYFILKKFDTKNTLGFSQLWLLCTVCSLTHLPLDYLNSYGVRPLLPCSDVRYFGDLLFIVDPWVWMILGLGLYTRVHWSAIQQALWMLVTVVGVGVTWRFGMFDGEFWMPWLVTVGILLSLSRYFRRPSESLRTGPAIASGVLLLYLCGIAWAHHRAEKLVREQPGALPQVLTQPVPGNPWHFTAITYNDTTVSGYRVNVRTGLVEPFATQARNLNDPALSDVSEVFVVKAWRSFARIPTVSHRPGMLVLGDARYGLGRTQAWSELYIPMP